MEFAKLVQGRLNELCLNVHQAEQKFDFKTGYIRGVLRQDEKKSSPSIDKVIAISRALGLEVYIGPPRPAPSMRDMAQQLSEQAAEFRHDRWVLPLEDLGSTPKIPRLALPERWLDQHGIAAQNAALVEQPDTSMSPSIPQGATVLIDTSLRDVGAAPGKVYAIRPGAQVQLRRCDLTDAGLIARADNTDYPISITKPAHLDTTLVLGRVRAVISELD